MLVEWWMFCLFTGWDHLPNTFHWIEPEHLEIKTHCQVKSRPSVRALALYGDWRRIWPSSLTRRSCTPCVNLWGIWPTSTDWPRWIWKAMWSPRSSIHQSRGSRNASSLLDCSYPIELETRGSLDSLLPSIFAALRLALRLQCLCPSDSTWRLGPTWSHPCSSQIPWRKDRQKLESICLELFSTGLIRNVFATRRLLSFGRPAVCTWQWHWTVMTLVYACKRLRTKVSSR